MKPYKIILAAVVSAWVLTGCDDEKMQWGKPDGRGDVSISDIPLNIAEQIANYDFIKSYAAEYMPGVTIGLGLDAALYLDDPQYKQVADDNFQLFTMGNEMKHSSVVGGNGALNFATIDRFFDAVPAAVSIYGHNLIWHTQQRASYLNGLIAPEVLPAPGGTNLLDKSGLESGDFSGWPKNNNAAGISIAEGKGMETGANAICFDTSNGSGGEWKTQLQSSGITAIVDHQYEISFYIRAEADGGEIRISFSGMSNGYPWVNGAKFAYPTTEWTRVVYNTTTIGSDFTATDAQVAFNFDMGQTADMIYYVDINTLQVIDLDAEPAEVNLITNGDFETGDLTGWNPSNPGAGITVVNSEKTEGSYAAQLIASPDSSNEWDLQLQTDALALTAGGDYTLSFYIKSDGAGRGRISFPGFDNEWPWMDWTGSGASGSFETSAAWMQVSVDLTDVTYKSESNTVRISFDLGKLPDVTYYLDDVKLIEKAPDTSASIIRSGPIIIEKTDEEKKTIITDAMEAWIKGMLDHCKDRVKMWDVLNEPIGDNLQLRGVDFVPAETGAQEFYWGRYMGKDYGVQAFWFARRYGNTGDLLFINEYGLETSPAKLTKLIEYINYIDEQHGSPVIDGIGTQMHVTLSITREQINAMFGTLAATGKLVRVTELDVRVDAANPTAAQLEQQAQVYQMIVESYKATVPVAQQSGITLWTLTDNAREHEYWLSGDAPNLFDADYGRKYAYKGFCDGIAGRNIGLDFTGDDWKNAYPEED
ncbi:MAG: endo-1,4-beta-xylanase [Mediterranea sp.]|jgi:GH35 family endo-1,4-beta-xylanase|nr:endo-1,4-beta-xylanase [Mediterranea sp.]